MRRANPIPRGNQASDELGPRELVVLWVLVASLLVPPGTFVFHLVAGNEDSAFDWAMNSIVPALIILLLFAGMRSSGRDTRQLEARGIPGTATVLSAEAQEGGYSAMLRIYVDGLEPFVTRARAGCLLTAGETVEVLVDPADQLFTIVYR